MQVQDAVKKAREVTCGAMRPERQELTSLRVLDQLYVYTDTDIVEG
jgi:hypothetical protein